MKDFIYRNLPIFLIGGATLVVFVIIILVSERRNRDPSQIPELVVTTEEEGKDAQDLAQDDVKELVEKIQKEANTDKTNLSENQEELSKGREFLENVTLTSDEVDSQYGPLLIKYTEDGFNPRNTNGAKSQLVIWENSSDQIIELVQKIYKFDDWGKDTKYIQPGESLELRLLDAEGLWVYQDVKSGSGGSIYIERKLK